MRPAARRAASRLPVPTGSDPCLRRPCPDYTTRGVRSNRGSGIRNRQADSSRLGGTGDGRSPAEPGPFPQHQRRLRTLAPEPGLARAVNGPAARVDDARRLVEAEDVPAPRLPPAPLQPTP